MKKTLKIFESFAGIGCQRIALRNLGISVESVGIMEVDKYALLGYDAIHNKSHNIEEIASEDIIKEINDKHIAYNFTTGKSEIPRSKEDLKRLYNAHIKSKNYGDIRKVDPSKLPDFDLFTYSPPCKNVSVEGKQDSLKKGSGTATSLLWECCEIIRIKRPKYLLFENVKNILAYNHKPFFDEFCKLLESYGYVNHYGILNALDFDLPQNRERCMMFSTLKEYDNGKDLPLGKRTDKTFMDIIDREHENEYLLKNKPREHFLQLTSIVNGKLRIPNGTKIGYLDMDIPGVFDFNRPTSKNRRGRVKQGGKITGTVMANEPNFIYVEWRDNAIYARNLTSLELWRLLGHSDEDFYKCKDILPERKLRERAGRSIAIPMLEEIFKTYLGEYINENNNK